MGYGIAHNLLKKNYSLSVIAHKNRKPIEKLVSQGAKESESLKDIASNDVIIQCVTNTPIAIEIIKDILPYLKQGTLFIDITTHHATGSIEANNLLKSKKVRYIESPVMGGPVQAEEGVLGAIVGADINDISDAKDILMNFCKDVFHFGEIGIGAKTKLISNFLSLGTATFVIETLKAAKYLNIDMQKLIDVARLGSGNSGALNRIADKAIEGDYTGYIFSVNNTLKDLTYINELLKDLPNAEKLSSLTKSFYKEAADQGKGELLISELIKD
jgi:3-hydroxyisobutyrate dehydrogenase-like beta-hydroxyacid dehydrogenase|tara:strand:- start:10 stop:825 length:816 start_codon:yes stop_codon:yes gene_type:complete